MDAASLAAFRVLFGLVMVVSTLRFIAKGWVYELYIAPRFHFSYWPFTFIEPPPGAWLYVIFALMAVSAFGVMVGAFYRASTTLFFTSFTYIELLDVSVYLNHYYLVSILSFLLIFIPAHRVASVDAWRAERGGRREPLRSTVPILVLWLLRTQIGLVYLFAGLAKLNGDWLFRAEPLSTWLPTHADLPLVGPLMDETWFAFMMSWAGAIYDVTAWPLLLFWRTRPFAYVAVIVFHITTGVLFRIGVFPFVMIALTTIFFAPAWPRRALGWLRHRPAAAPALEHEVRPRARLVCLTLLFLTFQLSFPLRQHLYPGNRLWTEQGYRFAWNVMLIEKAGEVSFDVRDPESSRRWLLSPRAELTPLQVKVMSTQPDLILQYAHHLAERFARERGLAVEVRADAWAAMNARRMQRLIDPAVDLARERDGFAPKPWIVPLRDAL